MDQSEPTISELFDLTGRTALITGVTGHLGRAMAAGLAEAGAKVIVSSRQLETAQHAAESLGGPEHGRHFGIAMDHLCEESIERGFAAALEQSDRIDILVNNGHSPLAADWTSVSGEEFTRHLANATGYFLLGRKVRDHAVARQGQASIVLIGSMYGVVGSYPEAYADICSASPAAYHALKGGIVQLTRHLAVYWAQDGVRVNCLSPGPFPGPQAPEQLIARLEERSPMRRMGRPYELKGAVVFLASDASSYLTGQNLLIDGGWTAW